MIWETIGEKHGAITGPTDNFIDITDFVVIAPGLSLGVEGLL